MNQSLKEELDNVGEKICAMLNGQGGSFFVKFPLLSDYKNVKPSDKEINTWESYIRKYLTPSAMFSFILKEGKLSVEVPQGKDIPYAYCDIVYLQDSNTVKKAPIEIIKDMVQRKQVEPERWERRFSLASLPEDLDFDEIKKQLESMRLTQRINIPNMIEQEEFLNLLSVIKYGRLTNAGDVLFSHNTASRYPQARIRGTCYPTDKTSDTYTDMKQFEGPLLIVLDAVYRFILRNTTTRVSFQSKGTERKERPQYPDEVIREALVNALVHRDYSNHTGSIHVHIFPERLEIFNSGAFLDGVTADTLLKGSISVLRNPDIAQIVYLNGRMEKAGRGSQLIVQSCKKYGLPEPEWRSEEGVGVTLILRNREVSMDDTMEVSMDDTMEVAKEVKMIVRAINGELSRKQIQEKFALTNAEHVRLKYIDPSIKYGFIEMTIPDKPQSRLQKYRLTSKGKELKDKLKRKTRKK